MSRSSSDSDSPRGRVWATLITNLGYLPGLLNLEYSLRRVGSRYPLVVFYTDAFPDEGHRMLDGRGISKQRLDYLRAKFHEGYGDDPRFNDTWTKLGAFGLVEYERIGLLDSDMLVVKNMDELMDIELDDSNSTKSGSRVFAASYACLCNPLKKAHYPADWVPENCPYTSQHPDPQAAQTDGPVSDFAGTMPNGGLIVFNPSVHTLKLVLAALEDEKAKTYAFADQALLGDVFAGRWVPLPYIYNALKFLKWQGVHDTIWQDEKVKNIHYALTPKPWEIQGRSEDELARIWQEVWDELEREQREKLVS